MDKSIQQQLLTCPREVRQYVLKQAAEIERLRNELAGQRGQVRYWQLKHSAAQDELVELRAAKAGGGG